jgi:thiol:disulfide interchange protein
MKFRFVAMTALALAGVSSTAHADIKWENDYAAAAAKSKESGKPIFIDFYTDWCGWCKKLEKDVYPNAKVEALADKFVMVKLDAERGGKDQAKAFQVKGFPTLVYVSAQGKELANNPGYKEADDLVKDMQKALDDAAASATPATK